MAGEAVRHAGGGEGRAARRRRQALRRLRRQGHHGVEPWRTPSRHHGDDRRGDLGSCRGGRHHRRGLRRRRYPARHRYRQGAGARRARSAARPAAAVGLERRRRRRRQDGDGSHAGRDGAGDAALRRGESRGADAGSGEGVSGLISAGKLRVGVANAPSASPLFVVKDADGAPRGVTVDLGNALAKELGVAAEFMVAPNTGELTDALEAGRIDVSFMPVDDERKKRIDFGPVYFEVESTYMVTEASGLRRVDDVDRPGIRVVGIAGTTTIRAAARSLTQTTITATQSIGEAVEMLTGGKADAFALSRDSLPPFVARPPGSRIVDGGFQLTGVAIAVPRARPDALAYVTSFIEKAKNSGVGRGAVSGGGLQPLLVAP